VINTDLHPISHRFEVIADYRSNFGRKTVRAYFVFSSRLLGAMGQRTLFILGSLKSA